MKKCTGCLIIRSIDDFAWKQKKKNTHRSKCKSCENEIAKNNWASGNLRESNYGARNKRRETAQLFIWEYLSTHGCTDCEEDNPVVLEFDHINDNKFKSVSRMVDSGHSLESIKLEIDKCQVVCCNCHRKRTATRGNWWRTKK